MKSVYHSPKLISHGSVESITRAFGSSAAEDLVFVGSSNVDGPSFPSSGSIDGTIVPQ